MARAKTQTELSFIEAAANDNYEGVEQILTQNNIDVNVQEEDKDGHTALHWAAIKGNLELVKLLIEKGADINVLDDHGTTALLVAQTHSIGFGRQERVVEFLTEIQKQRAEDPRPAPVNLERAPTVAQNPNLFFTVKPLEVQMPTPPTVIHKIQTVDNKTIEIEVTPQTVTPYVSEDEEEEVYTNTTNQYNNSDDDEINPYRQYDDAEEFFEQNRIYR